MAPRSSKYNKDLALLNLLDEETFLGLLNQQINDQGSFVDESRIKLNAKYMANPEVKQVLDLAYAAIDGGEDAGTVIEELMQRISDPNDVTIPKIDPDTLTDVVGGVLNSSQAKSKAVSSGSSGLELLTKLGVPEFAPLLARAGKSGTSETMAASPYAGVSQEQSNYEKNLKSLMEKTAGLKAETTRGAKTDWATAQVPKLGALEGTPLEFLQGLEGKKIPVGKAADVGAKGLRFLKGALSGVMLGGLPGALAEGGKELGKVNKTGTGWEKTWGSNTEDPEEVKKRQALALIALKKNEQDIAKQQQWSQDAASRQAKLNQLYMSGVAKAGKPNVPSEYDLTRAFLAKAMRG